MLTFRSWAQQKIYSLGGEKAQTMRTNCTCHLEMLAVLLCLLFPATGRPGPSLRRGQIATSRSGRVRGMCPEVSYCPEVAENQGRNSRNETCSLRSTILASWAGLQSGLWALSPRLPPPQAHKKFLPSTRARAKADLSPVGERKTLILLVNTLERGKGTSRRGTQKRRFSFSVAG